MRARVGLAAVLPAAFVMLGFAGPVDAPANDAEALEAFTLGVRVVEGQRRGETAEIWIDWIREGVIATGPMTRFERPFRATLGFNIVMPPTLKLIHVKCEAVKKAYDLNPNDLSFKVEIAGARDEGTLRFGLPDLRQRRGHPWAVVMGPEFCGG